MNEVEILKTVCEKVYAGIESLITCYDAASEVENLRTDEQNEVLGKFASQLQDLANKAKAKFHK